jgi:hypothetical protein
MYYVHTNVLMYVYVQTMYIYVHKCINMYKHVCTMFTREHTVLPYPVQVVRIPDAFSFIWQGCMRKEIKSPWCCSCLTLWAVPPLCDGPAAAGRCAQDRTPAAAAAGPVRSGSRPVGPTRSGPLLLVRRAKRQRPAAAGPARGRSPCYGAEGPAKASLP